MNFVKFIKVIKIVSFTIFFFSYMNAAYTMEKNLIIICQTGLSETQKIPRKEILILNGHIKFLMRRKKVSYKFS